LALPAVWKDGEVELGESGALGTCGLIRAAFVLHGPLVVPLEASNHECNLGPTSEVLALSRARECVEYDLEIIRDGDPDDRALRRAARVEGALHGVSTAPEEPQQGGASDGHLWTLKLVRACQRTTLRSLGTIAARVRPLSLHARLLHCHGLPPATSAYEDTSVPNLAAKRQPSQRSCVVCNALQDGDIAIDPQREAVVPHRCEFEIAACDIPHIVGFGADCAEA